MMGAQSASYKFIFSSIAVDERTIMMKSKQKL
jgi:hypothetical protein